VLDSGKPVNCGSPFARFRPAAVQPALLVDSVELVEQAPRASHSSAKDRVVEVASSAYFRHAGKSAKRVFALVVPAIHVFPVAMLLGRGCAAQGRHDELGYGAPRHNFALMCTHRRRSGMRAGYDFQNRIRRAAACCWRRFGVASVLQAQAETAGPTKIRTPPVAETAPPTPMTRHQRFAVDWSQLMSMRPR